MAAFGIALVYVKENFRHRLPHLLVLCYLVLLLIGFFLPTSDPSMKARMLKGFSLAAIGWLGVPAALLGALASMGRDFQEKLMRTVRAKPVRSHTLFLGKLWGSAFLSLFYTAVMGVASVIFLQTACKGQLTVHKEIRAHEFKRLGEGYTEEEEEWVQGITGKGDFLFFMPKEPLPSEPLNGEIVLRARFRKGAYRNEFPIVVGFRSKSPTHKNQETGRDKDESKVQERGGEQSPERGQKIQVEEQNIELRIKPGIVKSFSIPREMAGTGELHARIWCPLSGISFRIRLDSLRFIGSSCGFFIPFFKALTPLFFFMIAMGGVGAACGSFLSIPVAALLGLFVLFCGSVVGFLSDYARTLEREGLYLEARLKEEGEGQQSERRLVKQGIQAFCKVCPDWRIFYTKDWVERGRDVPGTLLGSAFLTMLKYLAIFSLVGIVALSVREAG